MRPLTDIRCFIARIQKLRLELGGGTPEVLANRVQMELKKWADLVREKNIRVDP